jgi:hypothetical protein
MHLRKISSICAKSQAFVQNLKHLRKISSICAKSQAFAHAAKVPDCQP